jgi:hypothetical protein
MKRARSFSKFVWPSLGALLLVANCTVKTVDDTATNCTPGSTHACTCTNSASGSQVCQADGMGYGTCQCDASGGSANGSGGSGGSTTTSGGASNSSGGASNSSGGASTTTGGNVGSGGYTNSGGHTNGGQAGAPAGGGAGGTAEGGAGGLGGDVCDECLLQQCPAEFDACLSDPACFGDGTSGQFEDMITCIEQVRAMTPPAPAKRIDVVNCGIVVGNNASSFAWPPDGMAQTTTDLINCMATGMQNTPNNNGWAQGDPDVATDPISQKWADGSCAKSSCTSPL